jgi:hypothetical protein
MTRAEHCRDCTEVDVVSVLPGGRNFGQKAQKGPEKNKVGRKDLWPNIAKRRFRSRIEADVAADGDFIG